MGEGPREPGQQLGQRLKPSCWVLLQRRTGSFLRSDRLVRSPEHAQSLTEPKTHPPLSLIYTLTPSSSSLQVLFCSWEHPETWHSFPVTVAAQTGRPVSPFSLAVSTWGHVAPSSLMSPFHQALSTLPPRMLKPHWHLRNWSKYALMLVPLQQTVVMDGN